MVGDIRVNCEREEIDRGEDNGNVEARVAETELVTLTESVGTTKGLCTKL